MLMCVMFFNPIGVVVNHSGMFSPDEDSANTVSYSDLVNPHNGNRVLQSVSNSSASEFQINAMWSQSACIWLVNTAVVLFILGKVLVFGEPSLPSKSDEYQTFKAMLGEADSSISQVTLLEYLNTSTVICVMRREIVSFYSVIMRPDVRR